MLVHCPGSDRETAVLVLSAIRIQMLLQFASVHWYLWDMGRVARSSACDLRRFGCDSAVGPLAVVWHHLATNRVQHNLSAIAMSNVTGWVADQRGSRHAHRVPP
jgi:hypothetical protein